MNILVAFEAEDGQVLHSSVFAIDQDLDRFLVADDKRRFLWKAIELCLLVAEGREAEWHWLVSGVPPKRQGVKT